MTGFSLEGKVALVTGGGTGIGKAIALEFAKFGASVAIGYYSSKIQAEEVIREIESFGRSGIAIQGDVTNEKDVSDIVCKAASFGGGNINILVNNAGNIFDSKEVCEMDRTLWDKTMTTDMTSTFLMCKHVIPIMKAQRSGRIINMSSVAAHNGGGKGTTPYAAAKAAVQAFSKGLAKEVAPDILVNCIAPGIITTRIHKAYVTDEERKQNISRIPLKREGIPQEVAGVAVLLAGEFGSYMTGEMIEVNGGLYMN
jgi:3-oxoacyl-[acyl-carrier protein] reductase